MEIKRFALGARFDLFKDELEESDYSAILGELTSVLPSAVLRGMKVYIGSCDLKSKHEPGVVTVVFTHGSLGKMRKVYRIIDSDARLHAMLEAKTPFIQNNIIRDIEGLRYLGTVDKDGICADENGGAISFNKKPAQRKQFSGDNTIIIAPNAFKGTIPAQAAVRHISAALRKKLPEVTLVPVAVADGGDGTLAAIKETLLCTVRKAKVTGPYGDKLEAEYIIAEGTKCIIESALASGLALCGDKELDPTKASSFGTGELILRAVQEGAKEITVCLGGSATNDCGIGLARALGCKFYKADRTEAELPSDMNDIAEIDVTQLDPLAKKASFTVVSDVRNPLTGPNGATYTFGPQKGASEEQLATLENGMRKMETLLASLSGRDIGNIPGSGAAGGMAAMLIALFNAKVSYGSEVLLDIADFDTKLRSSSFVITGEGRVDSTSLNGKVVGEIIKRTSELSDLSKAPKLALIAGSKGEGGELIEEKCSLVEYCGIDGEPLELFDKAAERLTDSIADLM